MLGEQSLTLTVTHSNTCPIQPLHAGRWDDHAGAAGMHLPTPTAPQGHLAAASPPPLLTMLCAEMIISGLLGGGAGSPPVRRLLDRYSSCARGETWAGEVHETHPPTAERGIHQAERACWQWRGWCPCKLRVASL